MRPSRRQYLRLATTGAVALAGCTGGNGGTEPGTEPPTETATEPPTETPTESPTSTSMDDASALTVTDQETDDLTVSVPSASIDDAGWLVVHPEADGGGPNGGVTLAEKQLSAGDYTDVSLELDTVRAGEQTVFGMLHYDDPADGEFTFPADGDPPVMKGGSPLVKPFTVTLSGTPTPALSVADQETGGRGITVPRVDIDDAGWLVVHPEADGGGPNGGVTLAEKRLEPGLYADLSLELDTVYAGEQTVYGMLHYDDPADGEFTFPSDGDPPVMKGGSPLVKPFTVTLSETPSPALSVADQETDGSQLTIPRVGIDDAGWLVVHPEADGGGPNGGVTLATRQLRPGLYTDVTLSLDEPLMDTQTVYGMLHYDDPADGEFTFPSDGDPPVTKDGKPLVKPFEATVGGG